MGAHHGFAGFAEFSHKRAIMHRTTMLPLTILPPVIHKGHVPTWMYATALKMNVVGFVPPRLQAALKLSAIAMAILAVAIGVQIHLA